MVEFCYNVLNMQQANLKNSQKIIGLVSERSLTRPRCLMFIISTGKSLCFCFVVSLLCTVNKRPTVVTVSLLSMSEGLNVYS